MQLHKAQTVLKKGGVDRVGFQGGGRLPNQTPDITLVLVDIYIFLCHEKDLTSAYGGGLFPNQMPAHPTDSGIMDRSGRFFQAGLGHNGPSELRLVRSRHLLEALGHRRYQLLAQPLDDPVAEREQTVLRFREHAH